jgi:hypothetical protein
MAQRKTINIYFRQGVSTPHIERALWACANEATGQLFGNTGIKRCAAPVYGFTITRMRDTLVSEIAAEMPADWLAFFCGHLAGQGVHFLAECA